MSLVSTAIVQELHVHPLKSARALTLERVRVYQSGFEWDRHWMVVRPDGRFLTQRSHPALARITAIPAPEGLRLECEGRDTLWVPENVQDPSRPVTIWKDHCTGTDQGDAAAAWIGAVLEQRVRLVRAPLAPMRRADAAYAPNAPPITFVDGFPLLVCNRASLEALNTHLPTPLPMERFRPNLVMAGLEPFAEDRIAFVQIGRVRLRFVKPCTRCVIPAQDQRTGVRDGDPLPTLRALRFDARLRGPVFGVNAVIEAGSGTDIERGASCRIIERASTQSTD